MLQGRDESYANVRLGPDALHLAHRAGPIGFTGCTMTERALLCMYEHSRRGSYRNNPVSMHRPQLSTHSDTTYLLLPALRLQL